MPETINQPDISEILELIPSIPRRWEPDNPTSFNNEAIAYLKDPCVVEMFYMYEDGTTPRDYSIRFAVGVRNSQVENTYGITLKGIDHDVMGRIIPGYLSAGFRGVNRGRVIGEVFIYLGRVSELKNPPTRHGFFKEEIEWFSPKVSSEG